MHGSTKLKFSEVLNFITNTPIKFLGNLAGTEYELPEDDEIASKHVGEL